VVILSAIGCTVGILGGALIGDQFDRSNARGLCNII
jgi:hypothetical protein